MADDVRTTLATRCPVLDQPDGARRQRAQAFYGGVLGWAYGEPAEEFGGYVVATVDGYPAAGIAPRWARSVDGFIASDDVDKQLPRSRRTADLVSPDQVGPWDG